MTKYFNKCTVSAIFYGLFLLSSCSAIANEAMTTLPSDQTQGGSALIIQRANGGDSVAMVQMGITSVLQGKLDEAYEWYKRAAEIGNPFGQYAIAMFHYEGHGVVRDLKLASTYMEKSALQGFDMAQHQYGKFLIEGIGVKKDIEKGLSWLHKALEQNYLPAKATLGELYWKDSIVKKDLTLARQLLKEGAEAGDLVAQGNYGEFLIAQESAQDYEMGIIWLKKAADAQEPKALYVYGVHLLETSRGKQDEAMKYIKASVMKGYAPAQTFLGVLILDSNAPENYHYASPLLMDAAIQNEPFAMYYLGLMYETGKGVELNKERADRWFKKSCEAGCRKACR